MSEEERDYDPCSNCGHYRKLHHPGGNCFATVGRCGDGCCAFLCDCSEFRDEIAK